MYDFATLSVMVSVRLEFQVRQTTSEFINNWVFIVALNPTYSIDSRPSSRWTGLYAPADRAEPIQAWAWKLARVL